jgi:branched-chain amino acid aminotransferase
MSGAASKKFRAEGTTFQIGKIEMVARYVEESGVMNVFFVFRDQGDPAANRNDPGGDHTRQRDHTLRDMGFRVKEDRISIDDVFKNYERGELLECFGTGTAATVSHVRRLRYKDQTLELSPVEQRKIGLAVRERLIAIMTGKVPDPYAWVEAL